MVFDEKKYQKEYRKKHKQEKINYNRRYYEKNKDRIIRMANEYSKKYYKKNREKKLKNNKKWIENNREHFRELMKKNYNNNKEKYRENGRRWLKTKKGKIHNIRNRSTYNRGKKWIQILPNIFPDDIQVDYHHIDGKIFIVPIPRKLHESSNGKNKDIHLKESNDWIEFYYGINPIELIKEKTI